MPIIGPPPLLATRGMTFTSLLSRLTRADLQRSYEWHAIAGDDPRTTGFPDNARCSVCRKT